MAISKTCVRMAGIRLTLAMMLALLLVPGYVVAPVLFAKLDSHIAGMVAGSIFHIANIGVLILAAALSSFWLRSGAVGRLNWGLLLVMIALVCANAFAIAPVMQDLKDAAGAIDALAKDDPQRVQFGILHGISEIVHLLSSLMAVVLVALGGAPKTS